MYKLRKNGLKLICYTRRINMFELKRFIAFIAAGLLLVAAKYYPSPLISGKYGKVIYYDYADCEIVEGRHIRLREQIAREENKRRQL